MFFKKGMGGGGEVSGYLLTGPISYDSSSQPTVIM